MIMIIGLGLAPSAISQIGLASGSTLDWKVLVVALVSFLVTAIVMTKAKGFLKIIPFLIGGKVLKPGGGQNKYYYNSVCFGLYSI